MSLDLRATDLIVAAACPPSQAIGAGGLISHDKPLGGNLDNVAGTATISENRRARVVISFYPTAAKQRSAGGWCLKSSAAEMQNLDKPPALTWGLTRLLEAPLVISWVLLVADAYWVAADGFNWAQKALLCTAFSIAALGLFGLDRLLRSDWRGGTRFFAVMVALHAWFCWVAASELVPQKPNGYRRKSKESVREVLSAEPSAKPPKNQEP